MNLSTITQLAASFRPDPEAIKVQKPIERRRSIIRDFSLNTSTHGIPGIARSQTWPYRIFWTVATIVFAGIMVFFIIQSFREFLAFPTQTSVAGVTERKQAFPAVSICNHSPIRADLFMDSFLQITNSMNLTKPNETLVFTQFHAFLIRNYLRELWNINANVSRFFYPLESILLSCKFNNIDCNASYFVRFTSIRYGSCYTFNAETGSKDRPVLQTTDGNGFGILKLEFYAHNHQNIPFLSGKWSKVT